MKIALISKKVYTLDWFPLLIICYPSNVFILTVLFLKVINSPGALSLSQKMIIKASLFSHMYAGNGKLTGTSFLLFLHYIFIWLHQVCGAQTLSSCGTWVQLPTWDLSSLTRVETVSSAMQGGFLNTGLLGKSLDFLFKQSWRARPI